MAKMREENEQDKVDRQEGESRILANLKVINQSVKDRLYRMKKEREQNESHAVALVEAIIEKLRKELTQVRY